MSDTLPLTIDGVSITVPPGTTILAAARQAGPGRIAVISQLETGTLGRRRVGSLDDLDVATQVEGFLGERERAGGGETERQNGGTDSAKGQRHTNLLRTGSG